MIFILLPISKVNTFYVVNVALGRIRITSFSRLPIKLNYLREKIFIRRPVAGYKG